MATSPHPVDSAAKLTEDYHATTADAVAQIHVPLVTPWPEAFRAASPILVGQKQKLAPTILVGLASIINKRREVSTIYYARETADDGKVSKETIIHLEFTEWMIVKAYKALWALEIDWAGVTVEDQAKMKNESVIAAGANVPKLPAGVTTSEVDAAEALSTMKHGKSQGEVEHIEAAEALMLLSQSAQKKE